MADVLGQDASMHKEGAADLQHQPDRIEGEYQRTRATRHERGVLSRGPWRRRGPWRIDAPVLHQQ